MATRRMNPNLLRCGASISNSAIGLKQARSRTRIISARRTLPIADQVDDFLRQAGSEAPEIVRVSAPDLDIAKIFGTQPNPSAAELQRHVSWVPPREQIRDSMDATPYTPEASSTITGPSFGAAITIPKRADVKTNQMSFGTRVKRSAFFEQVRDAGFSSWTIYNHTFLPLVYDSLREDYEQLISKVQAWDVSCQRQVEVSGPGAAAFTQLLTTRDLSKLEVGASKYAPMCDETGEVINDPIVLRIAPDTYWLSIADSDVYLWAKGLALGMGSQQVRIRDPDVSCLAIQGPMAPAVMKDLFHGNFKELKYYGFAEAEMDGIPLRIARAGWSAERGYELYLSDRQHGPALWERVMKVGEAYGIKPGCPNNIRRMEAALLSIGTEQGDPFELGLGKLVDLDARFEFIGRAALLDKRAAGLERQLVGLEIDGDPIQAYTSKWSVFSDDSTGGQHVGHVTSAVYSPFVGKNIAFAMVDVPFNSIATRLRVQLDGESVPRGCGVSAFPWVPSRSVVKKSKATVSAA